MRARLWQAFVEHRLGQHAAAIAFHLLFSAVPLVLLGIALLGAFGLEDVWRDTVAPSLEHRLSQPVFRAVDYSVDEIFGASKPWEIVFAVVLLLWGLTRAVAATSIALNEIHDVDDGRSWPRRTAITLGLAAATLGCVVAAFLALTVLPRLAEGVWHALLLLGAIAAAAMVLGLAVAVLVRYAPAEHPEPRWASAGSALIVTAWIVQSLAFGWWAGSVADYKSATGNLMTFLVLAAYAIVAAIVFLIGVELDELARKGPTRARKRASAR